MLPTSLVSPLTDNRASSFADPGVSEHAEAFGVSDGFKESLSKFLLGGVFREEQHVEASMRGG